MRDRQGPPVPRGRGRTQAALCVALGLGLLLLLAASRPARADELRIALPRIHADPMVSEDEFGAYYSLPGTYTERSAHADGMPRVHLTLRIPADRKVLSASIEGGSARRLPEAPPQRDQPWPRPRPEILGESWWHGERLVHLAYRALQTDARGGLRVWDGGEVVLRLGPAERPEELARRKREGEVQARERWRTMRAVIDNGEELPAPHALPGLPVADSVTKTPSMQSKAPTLDTGPYRYLIVTTAELADSFQPLVEFREQQGLTGIVVTLDEIEAVTRVGRDRAETLRYYLREAYERWAVDYVLLGGDTELVPTRYVLSTFHPEGGQTEVPTDMYYAGLDGDWNADGDAFYGEPYRTGADPGDFADFVPELAVGRAPVRNAQEAAVFVQKVLHYEGGAGGERFGRVLFASEVLFPQNWQPGQSIIRDGAQFSEGLRTTLESWGDGTWESLRLYENHTAYPGAEEETRLRFQDELDTGGFGLVHHIGHGFYYNMSVGDQNFLVQHADALLNGENTFVLMSLNCDSAAFDVNCLLERFLRNPNGGSVASIGSSRAAFDLATNRYQQQLYRVIFRRGRPRLGDAILETRLAWVPSTFFDTVDRWTQLVFTLLGDPAMRIWTGVPHTAVVEAPASVELGSGPITVRVLDESSAPVDSAAVVLRGGQHQMVVAYAGGDGVAQLDLPASASGIWELHVSGRNLVPVTRTLSVTDAPAAHLSLSGFSIDDGAGNANGRLEAGETALLTAALLNGGTGSVGAGTLSLSTQDEWVSVTQSLAAYPALLAGAQASATEPFGIAISPQCPDGHLVELELRIQESGGGSWRELERLELAAAQVEILASVIDDAAGNGDGIVDPDETVTLLVTLKNYGAARLDGVVAQLESSDPQVSILDGQSSWGILDGALSVAENTLDPLQVRESDTSAPRLYRLHFTATDGRAWDLEFDLRSPAAPTGLASGTSDPSHVLLGWDPSPESDLAGYRVERRIEGGVDWQLLTPDILRGGAVFLDESVEPLTRYEYRVLAVDAFGLPSEASQTVLVSTPPPEISCFPLPMGGEVTGASAVGQLDADGVPDLVVGSDRVYVIDGNCEEKLDGDGDAQTFGPINAVDGSFHQAGIAIGDLDGQGLDEFVASNWVSYELYVYDGNGQVLPGWPVKLNQRNWSTPVLGDLDLDGDLEIVVNDVSGWTYAFHHDGSEVADGDGDPARVGPIAPARAGEWFGRTTPALVDVDWDGRPEILFGSNFGGAGDDYFYALKADGTGNATGWPLNLGPNASFLASPAVGDVDDDGGMEIVASCENDSLYVWNQDGSPMREYPIYLHSRSLEFQSQAPSPALVDFEGDGLLEIVAVAVDDFDDARIHVFDVDGQERPGWPQLVPGLSESNPVVADLDGDGSLEIVFGIGGGADYLPSLLYVFHDDGQLFEGFPLRLDAWVRATPTLCDFDLDGRADLVLASWDLQIHVWDMGGAWDPLSAPWPTFHGNGRRDGHATAVAAKHEELPAQGRAIALSGLRDNQPNPFNPSTVLRFELPVGGARGELAVYDAAGRRVRTLWQGVLPGGVQSIRWDGRDASGAEVGSGIYYARLALEGLGVSTRKMALVR